MKVNGKTIRNMAKESNYSLMVGHILVDFRRTNDQEKDNSNGYAFLSWARDFVIDKLTKELWV